MNDYMIVLRGFGDIALNFSPVIAAYVLVAFYAHRRRVAVPHNGRARYADITRAEA